MRKVTSSIIVLIGSVTFQRGKHLLYSERVCAQYHQPLSDIRRQQISDLFLSLMQSLPVNAIAILL